jgi:predicted aconitase
MKAVKIIKISFTKVEVDGIIEEIDKLNEKFDKEYMGNPYDDIQNLQKLMNTLKKC